MGFGGGVQADLKGELVGADVTADHTTGSGEKPVALYAEFVEPVQVLQLL